MSWTRYSRTRRGGSAAAAAVVMTALALTTAASAPPAAGRPGAGQPSATRAANPALLKSAQKTGVVPGAVIVVLSGASVTGTRLRADSTARTPRTSSAAVNTTLTRLGATSIQPLSGGLPAGLKLGNVVVVHVPKDNSAAAVKALAATSGVSFAEPDRYVNTMNTGGQPLPAGLKATPLVASHIRAAAPSPALPANYGYASSFESYLNAQGVDVGGAYATLQSGYGQLPGTGETITNVSVGDLTDESMADAEVRFYGPTTILQGGQRYLDLPSMPLIPTYVAEPDGSLSGTASVERTGDPVLGEVGLDFSVMSPLPDASQRPGDQGSGFTDLFGIAPGANYRLVVPATPTIDEIAQAFIAAATQQPAPNVITASLGFGTDVQGFPGRYLEDDPLMRSIIAAIVKSGITVVDSSGDGTRLYTPTAVGPDGGATPTNVADASSRATDINDDVYSTTPSQVIDSGSIDAGATTTDDTLAVPPGTGGDAWRNPVYAETRTDGSANFASGWGQRLTLSAPGDNIPAFEHYGPNADSVLVVLNGGTSASAPEIAAAAAVVLQAGRLAHHPFGPAQVIRVLQRTGRAVATPPQADQRLNVGPQIDLAAAVDSVLRDGGVPAATTIARLSVAHRVMINPTGAAFTEYTDPGMIDLQDPAAGSSRGTSGEGLNGPVTFAADITGPRGDNYALVAGNRTFASTADYIRVTPAELLAAAGQPVVSTATRTVTVSYQVRQGRRVLAQLSHTLAIGPTDGSYTAAQAPVVAPVVAAGQPVNVSYDLTGATGLSNPELVVSAAGHWNPSLGPVFNAAYSVPLSSLAGTVTLSASAFDNGGGVYGIGIEQNSASKLYGVFASVRVTGFPAGFQTVARPAAPLLAVPGGTAGHSAEVSRSAPDFTLSWNAGRRADGAVLEISAPAPTVFGSYSTFSDPNGTQRDGDGLDAGSLVYEKLPAATGTQTFSALALGLPTSLSYDVRILPTGSDGVVDGQASPTSQLIVDDGLAPGGAIIDNFAMAGADSVASIVGPGGAQVAHYNPAAGTYGSVIASDTSGGQFYVFGVDPAAHTVLVDDIATASGGQGDHVELYDTRTGALIAAPGLSGYRLKGGLVDAAHDRADLLAAGASGADTVIAVSMLTGALGTVSNADNGSVPAGTFADIAVDGSTGDVFLGTTGGGICFGGTEPIAEVDPATGIVTSGQGGSRCDVGIAVDQAAGSLIFDSYRAISVNFAGSSSLNVVSEAGLTSTASYPLRTGRGLALAADPVHHLALVLYNLPAGQPQFGAPGGMSITDSNAMSEIDVIDIGTGKIIRTIDDFSAASVDGYPFARTSPAIQLDPATRTGFIYGPGTTQIQQFSY